jgi:hypothetical protein
MLNRKRCFSFLAFLIGGFSLGALSLGEEYGAHRDWEPAQGGMLGFRHNVYLREGAETQYEKPAPRHSGGGAGVRLPERRKWQAPNPYAARRFLPPTSPYAGRRFLQTPTPYAMRRKLATPSPYLARRADPTPSPYIVRRAVPTPSPVAASSSQLWLQPTSFTPYDRYMGNVRAVINHLEPHPADMSLACQLMQEGRRFEYVTADPYTATPPRVTAMSQAGDCKAKALWLYNCLGDSSALFVIGKTTRYSRTSHAWVYWRNENRWWILDCTNRSQPIAADSVPQDRYVPYYSYSRNGAFRHQATRLLIDPMSPASGTPAVADH